MNTKFSVIALGLAFSMVAPSAHALTAIEKNLVNTELARTQAQLLQRIAQYKQEQTPLSEMKADLIVDMERTGLEHAQAEQVADRFESEAQVISSLENAASQTALAGPMIFANSAYYFGDTAEFARNHPVLSHNFPVMTALAVVLADFVLLPTSFAGDISNLLFESKDRHQAFGLLTGGIENVRDQSPRYDARAAWASLVTVPVDVVLTPFYVVGTVLIVLDRLGNNRW